MLLSLALMAAPAAQPQRLNIVHIMSDDHSYQTISAYGHPISQIARTPNIDRIASQGIRFDRAYVENSLSAPSRACLITGRYSHQNGQRTIVEGDINESLPFLSELMQGAGYQTAMVGKWHLPCEPKGFDFFYILKGQGEYYTPTFRSHNSKGKYVADPKGSYVTEQITEHAIEFLEQRDESKPFMLFVHHKAPHRNWMPATKYVSLYEDEIFPMPENFYDDFVTRGAAERNQKMSVATDMTLIYDLKVSELGENDPTLRMSKEGAEAWKNFYHPRNVAFLARDLKGKELAEWKYQNYIKDYVRVIKSVDDSVGEILDYLEAHNLMDNTVIIYTSDQGFYMGEHGWFDKRFMFEESFRTPLVVRYPGKVKRGISTDVMVQNLDYAPTYLDIAGVEKPDYMPGMSYIPVIKKNGKEPRNWRDYLYYHYYEFPYSHNVSPQDGVFDKRYKLIHFYKGFGSYDELFDLEKDPTEMNNVYDDPAYLKIRQRLEAQLDKFRREQAVDEW